MLPGPATPSPARSFQSATSGPSPGSSPGSRTGSIRATPQRSAHYSSSDEEDDIDAAERWVEEAERQSRLRHYSALVHSARTAGQAGAPPPPPPHKHPEVR